MKIQNINIPIKTYSSINELVEIDYKLVILAQKALEQSYSPYSNFKVGAAAILEDNTTICGSNQENSSYGVTLCAERVLIAKYLASDNKNKINTMAISYKSIDKEDNTPITPCGICRQTLSEAETKQNAPIRLILTGQSGVVLEIEKANDILPLAFTGDFFAQSL